MNASVGATKTYRGSCHCGACRFEVDMNLDHVRSCNCSICRKRGALNHRVPAEAFRPLTPLTDLTIYQWHTRTAKDYFCPTCGILPFRIPSAPTAEELAQGAVPFTGWVINVRCLEGVILEDIPIKKIFGADLS
ncbi:MULTISPECIES: GFA family protein [unclassified Achromobacter]|uniref:GFA family protein n=1 Tax=unclassified Achromobacter TaxID=2626865 RepID=UPI001E2BFFDD|nr:MULTISPECIES: GFA family protein [unclassified Achromobacter]